MASDRKNSSDLVTVNLVSCKQKKDTLMNTKEEESHKHSVENEIDSIQENFDITAEDCKHDTEPTYIERNTYFSRSVQGSFHQAHPIFGDNAGTQCVANCLAGLAYEQFKKSTHWTSQDMNNILATGDELYTFLQRSSSMHNRYLLVEELPQYFECFNRSFEFSTNSTLATIISLSNEEPCYADFNAFPLFEALQMGLLDTDGCFVCFSGNTFLIGRTNDLFFTFDSHSRTSQGLFSHSGRSTRILFKNIDELYMHIQMLAKSMGFSSVVECNITGVKCNSITIEHDKKDSENACRMMNKNHEHNLKENHADECENEVVFLQSEMGSFRFCPITEDLKEELCNVLAIPYTQKSRNCATPTRLLGKPCLSAQIIGDGNCFFRAVSYSLTSTENHYHKVRSAVCKHLLENKDDFVTFLRSNDVSVESHVSSMMHDGNWATELEILALAHMLSVDIFTYSESRWIKFLGQNICSSMQLKLGGLYLNHRDENHYDVVLDVA